MIIFIKALVGFRKQRKGTHQKNFLQPECFTVDVEDEIKATFSAMQTIRSSVLSNQVLLRIVSALHLGLFRL